MTLLINEFKIYALFYMINAKTTYNMLLRRPWKYESGVVSSTLHQWFKYYQNGQVKKANTNSKPFTMVKSYFANAKFYDDLIACDSRSTKGTTRPKKTIKKCFYKQDLLDCHWIS